MHSIFSNLKGPKQKCLPKSRCTHPAWVAEHILFLCAVEFIAVQCAVYQCAVHLSGIHYLLLVQRSGHLIRGGSRADKDVQIARIVNGRYCCPCKSQPFLLREECILVIVLFCFSTQQLLFQTALKEQKSFTCSVYAHKGGVSFF